METPLQIAVRIAGSQAALAKQLQTAPAFVSHWVTGRRPVPPRFARLIEEVTEGAVSKHQLRPDVFGTEPAVAPQTEPDPDADRIQPVEGA